MDTFSSEKVFRHPLRALYGLFLSTQFFLPASSHGFIYPQSSVLQAITSPSSVFFPFLFHRTPHGGVGQRSGSRLETKNKRNWALPRAFLNHMSLGVDVPFFLHPGECIFSMFFYILCLVTQYMIHLEIYQSSKLCNNSSFG